MSKIKNAYYYLFYKLYKWYERGPFIWMSDWKASINMDVLMIFLFSSLLNYYKVFFNPTSEIGEGNILIVFGIIISLSNYFIFQHKDQWKVIIQEFDTLPKQTNIIGTLRVWLFVILIISNFIYSFYLFYQS